MHRVHILPYMNEKIRSAARRASAELTKAGIVHAICGGLAVGHYGYPRMTVDVDFAVGDDAFNHHPGGLVTLKIPIISVDGVPVDFVSAPFEAAGELDGVPVVSLQTLVEMKLGAGRAKDIADVVELIKRGAIAPETIAVPPGLRDRWARAQRLAETEDE